MAEVESQQVPSTSNTPAPGVEVASGDVEQAASSTIYIKNLNEKVKLPILKTSLESLFAVYGHVLGITAHGNLRMRGQAFVAFDDVEVAKKAVKEVNGFPLYGKPMQLAFAKTPSDSVVLLRSSQDQSSPTFQEHKSDRLKRKEERRLADEEDAAAAAAAKAGAAGGAGVAAGQKRKHPDDGADAAGPKKNAPPQMPDEYLPPNPILFIQNLPSAGVTREELESLFREFDGLQDVRTIPGRNVAFVEYVGAIEATRAREALNGKKINEGDEAGMRITFARAS